MGNSPSKNDTAVNSSSSSSPSTLGSSSSAELDTDDSALSRHSNQIPSKSPLSSTKKPPTAANSNGAPNGTLSSFDLEISASMARLLTKNSRSQSFDYMSSSLESDKSIFSNSSISSVNSTPPKTCKISVSNNNLDPIFERSVESTPEPRKTNKRDEKPKLQPVKTFSNVGAGTRSLRKLSKLSSQQSDVSSNSTNSSNSANSGEVDIDAIIEKLMDIGVSRSYSHALPFSKLEINYILSKSRTIFMSQPTLLKLAPPVKVVGDIHGQFHDLVRIFQNCGFPPYSNYLFLGDYVDRGKQSLETILLMLCFKIKYPENFFMLRGNHESANITKIYGFYDECKRRLSTKIWKQFIDVFNTLPIAATINDKIFAIHGGLSPDLSDLKQISKISRPTDIPETGLLADLLWSDPDSKIKTWAQNDRGVSYCFGKKQVDQFCSKFKFDLIVRGHMVVEDGYEFFDKRKLVTVFSAPNYCGEFNNFGAVMSVDKHLLCSFELIKPEQKRRTNST